MFVVVLDARSLSRERTAQADSDSHHTAYDYEAPLTLAEDTGTKPRNITSTHQWTANSQLQQIDAFGALQSQYISSCAGRALNYNKVQQQHASPRVHRRCHWRVVRRRRVRI